MTRFTSRFATFFLIALAAQPLRAQIVTPVSYSAYNSGNQFTYGDDSYPGCPCSPYAVLTGGRGDVLDGLFSSFGFEVGYPSPNGYVGYDFNPSFIFHFADPTNIGHVRLHVDHAGIAGVYAPSAVNVGETTVGLGDWTGTTSYTVATLPSYGRYWLDVDVSAQNLDGITDLTVGLTRTEGAPWMFVDEFEFIGETSATPEPASLVLLATGLLGIATFARRRRR